MPSLAVEYRPRRPTESVLYRAICEHLETFLAHARESYERPLPHYVEQELRGYLRCGVFAHGFVRCHCDTCGHDLLVAFSCKGRGICPSCAGRRMSNTAAHLVDRVLPAVPVRQWVLSLPFELRALAAFKADVLSALVRIFIEAVFTRYLRRAAAQGLGGGQCGAVTFVQRFGSSLNLNVHFHVVVLDGVFARDTQGSLVFHPATTPERRELDEVVARVSSRAVAWLDRRGHTRATASSEPASALDACAALAMHHGSMRAIRATLDGSKESDAPQLPRADQAVDHDGFNLHASVALAARDDLGREMLCRYGARPPLALGRLRALPGGHIAYRIKKLQGGRAKHRVMTPLELLARLAALVPPPRYPLVRYHGVLAPRAPWRREIVPRARAVPACGALKDTPREARGGNGVPRPSPSSRQAGLRSTKGRGTGARLETEPSTPRAAHEDSQRAMAAPDSRGAAPVATSGTPLLPNVLSVRHWDRLLQGRLLAVSPRVEWATLLRRCFAVDVLECAKCHGRLRVLGEITAPALVSLVLESLSMPTEAPRAARARDPTELLGQPLSD